MEAETLRSSGDEGMENASEETSSAPLEELPSVAPIEDTRGNSGVSLLEAVEEPELDPGTESASGSPDPPQELSESTDYPPESTEPEVESAVQAPPERMEGQPDRTPCSLGTSTVQSELLHFVQLHDVVACDFDQDGIVDILALNHRVSTGYGFTGIGNGIFSDGPSFDLPFRPAAAACIGDPLDNNLVLVSTEGSIALFHPLASADPPTRVVSTSIQILPLAGGEFSNTFAVVNDQTGFAEVYRLSCGGLTMLGQYMASPTSEAETWYEDVLAWGEESLTIPAAPASLDRKIRIADLNCDGVPDVVSVERRRLTYRLSQDNVPLASTTHVDLGIDALTFRLADVDGNGLTDVIVLSSAGGIEVVLFESSGMPEEHSP